MGRGGEDEDSALSFPSARPENVASFIVVFHPRGRGLGIWLHGPRQIKGRETKTLWSPSTFLLF